MRGVLALLFSLLSLEASAAARAEAPGDPRPWSFQPLRCPVDVPTGGNGPWDRHPIDRFVAARLLRAGLLPSPPATRPALLRRASIALIGMPATEGQLDAFLADRRPEAFARTVDSLLASPQYGERWARHWLDAMRYAEADIVRPSSEYVAAFRYRDFVIEALNADMPWDRFVLAHLAGDQLEARRAGPPLVAATGWAALGPWLYGLGGLERSVADEQHERVDTLGRAFLGLTVGCARCHDHKSDPITQADYYALAGVFHRSRYTETSLASPAEEARFQASRRTLEQAREALRTFEATQARGVAEALAGQASRYLMAAREVLLAGDSSVLSVARAEALDPEVLRRWSAYLVRPHDHGFLEEWHRVNADPRATAHDRAAAAARFEATVLAVLQDKAEVDRENERIYARHLPIKKKTYFAQNSIDSPYVNLKLVEVRPFPRVRQALYLDLFVDWDDPFNEGIPSHRAVLMERGPGLERFLSPTVRDHLVRLRAAVDRLERAMPARPPFVHALEDVERDPADLRLQRRGDVFDLGEIVPRRFVRSLSEGEPRPFVDGSGRRELGEAIVQHPLSTRAIVNRIWAHHFGRGLVATVGDLGAGGDPPSHPELLEWLSCAFLAHGRSLKALHRIIMSSQTWQQSGAFRADAADRDPDERLLWRHPRRRVEAEVVRDSLLLFAGALDRAVGGPSFEDLDVSVRRTLYASVNRARTRPFFQLFDVPDPSISSDGRHAELGAAQALYFLNGTLIDRAAQAIARRTEGASQERRVERAYRVVLGRSPSDEETLAVMRFLDAEGEGGRLASAQTLFVRALLATAEAWYVP